ncbi:MAG: hypothetical protein PHS93_09670 [Candidatus Omnitrophica bacterium]|nr:hypothetical protein [Candidatus Omnitrophota bacterium]
MMETIVYWGFRIPENLTKFQEEVLKELDKTKVNCKVQIRARNLNALSGSQDVISINVGEALFKIYDRTYDTPITVKADHLKEPVQCYDAATAARVIVKEGKKRTEDRIKMLTDVLKSMPPEE